jgi:hypothetical protein
MKDRDPDYWQNIFNKIGFAATCLATFLLLLFLFWSIYKLLTSPTVETCLNDREGGVIVFPSFYPSSSSSYFTETPPNHSYYRPPSQSSARNNSNSSPTRPAPAPPPSKR